MKNSKLFALEAHLDAAMKANPKRDLYLHLRKAEKIVKAATAELRDGNPAPPTIKAYQREIRESRSEMESLHPDRQREYLAAVIARHPDAKADAIAWDEENQKILDGETEKLKDGTEVKFESKEGHTAWKNDVCVFPVEVFDALVDAGVFTE